MFDDFYRDRAEGRKWETAYMEYLKEVHGRSCSQAPEGVVLGWDLLVNGIYAEVKRDLLADKTGNIAVEVAKGNGDPSGINATVSQWWIFICTDETYIVKLATLKDICESGKEILTNNRTARIVLVPQEDLRVKAHRVFPTIKIAKYMH